MTCLMPLGQELVLFGFHFYLFRILLLVGVGVEISLMFSIAGLALSKLLPPDPKTKLLGVNVRLLFTLGWAAFFAVFEIFLVQTPTRCAR